VVLVGDTAIVAPVPTKVPPQLPEYQVQAAPEPNEPPATDKVVEFPEHIGLTVADALVGAVEKVLRVTVTEAQLVVLQVPCALT
jgi:hypothetical protein